MVEGMRLMIDRFIFVRRDAGDRNEYIFNSIFAHQADAVTLDILNLINGFGLFASKSLARFQDKDFLFHCDFDFIKRGVFLQSLFFAASCPIASKDFP